LSVLFASKAANGPLVPLSRLAGHPDNIVRPVWWHPITEDDPGDLQGNAGKSDNSTVAESKTTGLTGRDMPEARGQHTGSNIEGRESVGVGARLLRELSPSQLEAVVEDSQLGRLLNRYEKRLSELELPEGGFTSKEQADEVTRLRSTFYQLQNIETGFGLPLREIPPKLREGERLRSEWQNHHDKEGRPIAVRPRGRPRRDAGDEGRIFLG
jgi:hypothetical protein